MDLFDKDFRPSRRVINEQSSLDECVNKVFVKEVTFIDESNAVARNAHNTALLVRSFSRIRSHRLIDSTAFTLGIWCHTTNFMPPVWSKFVAMFSEPGFGY